MIFSARSYPQLWEGGEKNLLQRHMKNLELPCFKRAELSISASCARKAISIVPVNSRYYMYNEAKFSTLR